MKTLWRELLYKEMEKLTLSGKVIDLGGSKRSGYHALLKGEHKIEVVNLNKDEGSVDGVDWSFDLEEKFPLGSSAYESVMCINVLEHIFNYQNVLDESWRILKDDGEIVLAVPFLIQIHPSPHDHFRYSKETLEKLLSGAGFKEIEVKTIGTGLFGANYQLKHNLLKIGLIQGICKGISKVLDNVLSSIKPSFGKEFYPLGYLVIAKK